MTPFLFNSLQHTLLKYLNISRVTQNRSPNKNCNNLINKKERKVKSLIMCFLNQIFCKIRLTGNSEVWSAKVQFYLTIIYTKPLTAKMANLPFWHIRIPTRRTKFVPILLLSERADTRHWKLWFSNIFISGFRK